MAWAKYSLFKYLDSLWVTVDIWLFTGFMWVESMYMGLKGGSYILTLGSANVAYL